MRDGLQLDRKPISRMRADFAKISRTALCNALDAVGHKLFVIRDPKISRPYGYLLAVAKNKERLHQRNRAHQTQTSADQRQHEADRAHAEDAIRQEEHQREHHPEDVLPATVGAWLKAMAGRIPALRRTFARELTLVLASLRSKIGAALDAQLDAVRSSLIPFAAQARPDDATFAQRLHNALAIIVADADTAGDGRTTPTVACSPDLVRGSPRDPPTPHVSGTHVSP